MQKDQTPLKRYKIEIIQEINLKFCDCVYTHFIRLYEFLFYIKIYNDLKGISCHTYTIEKTVSLVYLIFIELLLYV